MRKSVRNPRVYSGSIKILLVVLFFLIVLGRKNLLRFFAFSVFLLLFMSFVVAAPRTSKGQKAPTPQRVAEIQQALLSHGYTPGNTWDETHEILRMIADEHFWQTDHAPDVRVLGLIGLAGPHFDPTVLDIPNHLDEAQRKEAARTGTDYPLCKKENCTRIR